MSYSSGTIFVPMPFKDASGNCSPCNNGCDPTGCCKKEKLSPRRKRERTREQLKDYILLSLGAPTIKLEISEQALEMAIDQALKIFEDYAPREFFDYTVINSVPGKSVYELPPDVGYVRNVFYKQTPTFSFSANDLGGAIPVEYFYPGGAYSSIQGGLIDPIQPIWGRMGEWVQYKGYEAQYAKMSSSIGGWEWVDGYRNIKVYPIPCKVMAIIVHYLKKCADFEINQFLQEYSLALTKIMLGRIRGKIKNPPGGIQLDYAELLQEGKEEKKQLEIDVIYKFGDILPITMS